MGVLQLFSSWNTSDELSTSKSLIVQPLFLKITWRGHNKRNVTEVKNQNMVPPISNIFFIVGNFFFYFLPRLGVLNNFSPLPILNIFFMAGNFFFYFFPRLGMLLYISIKVDHSFNKFFLCNKSLEIEKLFEQNGICLNREKKKRD
ncbi:hypothetical protein EUGRSUZ_F02238 [Eucalyptus grandis]|uniref:Uncharacterized protein n=2 Tax=Eucalyptus grandis TaxID=71139 RepID=A0A059BRP7_EUCGR|nr:hypothetical protein EUGRSUZ_F02238 [Eucalyptus grandis]